MRADVACSGVDTRALVAASALAEQLTNNGLEVFGVLEPRPGIPQGTVRVRVGVLPKTYFLLKHIEQMIGRETDPRRKEALERWRDALREEMLKKKPQYIDTFCAAGLFVQKPILHKKPRQVGRFGEFLCKAIAANKISACHLPTRSATMKLVQAATINPLAAPHARTLPLKSFLNFP